MFTAPFQEQKKYRHEGKLTWLKILKVFEFNLIQK